MEKGMEAVKKDDMKVPDTVRIREKKYNLSNILVSLISLVILVSVNIWTAIYYNFSLIECLEVALVSLLMYVVLLYVLIRTNYSRLRLVKRKKDSKEVIKAIVNEIKRDDAKERTDIQKPSYIGSTETRTYHLRSCRLAKLIKSKYKLSDDTETFFKSKKFKACKLCLKK